MQPANQPCEFCSRLEAEEDSRPWYDFNVIWESPEFVVLPALGALVPGYLLLVPRRHRFSMAALAPPVRPELYAVTRALLQLQAEQWEPGVVFEHGACIAEPGRAEACIEHAHWHLVPGGWNLRQEGDDFRQVSNFERFAESYRGERRYLFLRDVEARCWVSVGRRLRRQEFRRRIAAALGAPASWDYLTFPFLDNMRATIAGFREVAGWLSQLPD